MCGSGIVPGRCACEKEKATRNARSPLNASARRALSAYLQLRPKAQPGESLFLSDRNGAFSPRAVQTLLQRLARRAEIARLHVTPHLVRHTFALNYLRQNPGKLLLTSAAIAFISAMIYPFVVGDQIPKQAGKHGSEGCHDVQQDRTPRLTMTTITKQDPR